ncbi:MAG: NTP transferase domain-containing protein [Methanosarcinales archaeon]
MTTQRNIEIDLDVWKKLKLEATKRNKNVRQLAGEILADYVKKSKIKLKKPKVIILAAGPGSRLMPLTKDKPKCMIKIKGKTILERQIEVFKQCGIEDIIVVRGHKKNVINYPGLKYYYNPNYQNNNILASLFHAESEMDDEFIVSYSDILIDKSVVKKLLQSHSDISVVTDTNWRSHYSNRYQHPIEEAEKVVVKDGKIIKTGKGINPNEVHGEFIGLVKFSKIGAEILRSNYNIAKNMFSGKPFHEAPTFEKAYLTDMIQELVNRGFDVKNVDIDKGWLEIDTVEDVKRASLKIGG